MRSRIEIEKAFQRLLDENYMHPRETKEVHKIQLEVLLDIRDAVTKKEVKPPELGPQQMNF